MGYLDLKRTIHSRKSENFILEGSPVQGLFFVYKGKAKVYSSGAQGGDQIVRFVGNGDTVGHRGFLSFESCYMISADALEDSILCHFTSEDLLKMLHSIANLSFDLMIFYAEELQRSEEKVNKFAQMNVRERVIDSLMYLKNKFGVNDGFINIKISRKEIADFAGTTDKQVTRVMSNLKQENLIYIEGKLIKIIDEEKLLKETSF